MSKDEEENPISKTASNPKITGRPKEDVWERLQNWSVQNIKLREGIIREKKIFCEITS